MMKIVSCATLIALASVPSALRAADRTWTGTLVDGRCSAKIAQAGPRTPSQMDGDHACAVKCVAGGEKYVFVSDGKIYQISNQEFAGLNDNLGYRVALVGGLSGDRITVSKIEKK